MEQKQRELEDFFENAVVGLHWAVSYRSSRHSGDTTLFSAYQGQVWVDAERRSQ